MKKARTRLQIVENAVQKLNDKRSLSEKPVFINWEVRLHDGRWDGIPDQPKFSINNRRTFSMQPFRCHHRVISVPADLTVVDKFSEWADMLA
jgi:hypothetical protein